ncbi:MAG: hypothetical protein V1906_02050, partial [Candidatus Woesearchaeota archaeon]
IQVLNPWDIKASDGAMKLNLQNRVGGSIDVTGASVTIDNSLYNYTATGTPAVTSGSSQIVEFALEVPGSIGGAIVGNSYTATVTIDYNYTSNGVPSEFSSTGTISGTYS